MKWFRISAGRPAAVRCVAAAAVSALLLTACGGVSEEMLDSREAAIAMMEAGDLEGAVEAFNGLVAEATKVTEFELDILKYRAEAEFLLGDFPAAAHTYKTLMEVDAEKPEYCYFASLAMSRGGQQEEALALLERGEELDRKLEAAGWQEAVLALAESYESAGMIEEAKEVYQGLIDGGHASTDIYNRLMLAAMDEGDYENALTMAGKGLILTDELAVKELRFNEAVCYEYLGDYQKALELFRAYVAEFGSDERAEHEIAFLETR